jgi:hypothetical protein
MAANCCCTRVLAWASLPRGGCPTGEYCRILFWKNLKFLGGNWWEVGSALSDSSQVTLEELGNFRGIVLKTFLFVVVTSH